MSLKEKINTDLVSSMKMGDKVRTETIRSIRALILEFEKKGENSILTPDDEIILLSSAIKRRKESIEMFEKGNRFDLVEKEKKEIEIILQYLPKQLSESEAKEIIYKILDDNNITSSKDFGKAMGFAMKELKGKFDNSKISEIIKSKIQ